VDDVGSDRRYRGVGVFAEHSTGGGGWGASADVTHDRHWTPHPKFSVPRRVEVHTPHRTKRTTGKGRLVSHSLIFFWSVLENS
jgi:hypothetical protein